MNPLSKSSPVIRAAALAIVAASAAACRNAGPPDTPDKATEGQLPAEVIQAVVQSHYAKFRRCYEDGLKRSPSLQGRVSVSFVIDSDGSVRDMSDGGSDMADSKARECVIAKFAEVNFPAPKGGKVTVVYPIWFSPDSPPASDRPAPARQAPK